jgi:hypothetical protein
MSETKQVMGEAIRAGEAKEGFEEILQTWRDAQESDDWLFRQLQTLFETVPASDAPERETRLRALVNSQAEDAGLWFEARTAPEAYLQQELRRLHAAIEELRLASPRASAAPEPEQRFNGDCPLGPKHEHLFSLWDGEQCEYCMQTRAEIARQVQE